MGLQRLDDAELGRRTRERNTRANQIHRERLMNAGKRQTNVWLSAELREQLDDESAATGVALSQIVEQLLADGLNYRELATPRPAEPVDARPEPARLVAEPADKPVKPTKATPDYSERDRLIRELHGQGMSYPKIGAALAEKGYLSSVGTPLSKGAIGRILERAGLTKEGAP